MFTPGCFSRASAVALTLLAGVVLLAPPAAGAQTPAPVKITKCEVLRYHGTTPVGTLPPTFRRGYWYDYGFSGPVVPYGTPYTDGIAISFENLAPKVADRVVFGVDYRGDFQHVVDAGTFSPNVAIDHTFADIYSGYAYIGSKPNSCVVRAVRFTDGTTWRAPGFGEHRQAM